MVCLLLTLSIARSHWPCFHYGVSSTNCLKSGIYWCLNNNLFESWMDKESVKKLCVNWVCCKYCGKKYECIFLIYILLLLSRFLFVNLLWHTICCWWQCLYPREWFPFFCQNGVHSEKIAWLSVLDLVMCVLELLICVYIAKLDHYCGFLTCSDIIWPRLTCRW